MFDSYGAIERTLRISSQRRRHLGPPCSRPCCISRLPTPPAISAIQHLNERSSSVHWRAVLAEPALQNGGAGLNFGRCTPRLSRPSA